METNLRKQIPANIKTIRRRSLLKRDKYELTSTKVGNHEGDLEGEWVMMDVDGRLDNACLM